MANSTATITLEHAKRSRTTGILRQLYETKLLSLIYFRAIHDDNIQEVYLASIDNKIGVEEGTFDDICFRAKVKDNNKPLAVFIQVKHSEKNPVLSLEEKDFVGYFKSYLEIRRKFEQNNRDAMFKEVYRKTRCYCVIHTNAKLDQKFETVPFKDETLNSLLRTDGKNGLLLSSNYYSKFDLSKIVLKEQVTALAQTMANHIFTDPNYSLLMRNYLVKRYHVVLARNIFDISEVISGNYRIARFRNDFFDIKEELLRLFKDELCTEILKRRQYTSSPKEFNLSPKTTDVKEIYKAIGSFVIYRNGKFQFLDTILPPCAAVPFLCKVNESDETIRETLELAVKECLPTLEFKVPASFGNKDLTIDGNQQEVKMKLNVLTHNIVKLFESAEPMYPNYCVIIDKTIDENILQLNGIATLASAVGNLLVSDDNGNLKFNTNYKSLGELAKRLYRKLGSKVDYLCEYRFKDTIDIFPALSFRLNFKNGCSLEHEFYSSLVFYTSQCN